MVLESLWCTVIIPQCLEIPSALHNGYLFLHWKTTYDYMVSSTYSSFQEKAMAIYTWFLWLSSSQWQMFLDCRCRNVTGHPVRLPKMMLITVSALLRSRCSSSQWEIESRVAPTLFPLLSSHWECKWPKGHICLSLHLSLWPRIPEFPVNKSSMSLSLIVGECTLAEG